MTCPSPTKEDERQRTNGYRGCSSSTPHKQGLEVCGEHVMHTSVTIVRRPCGLAFMQLPSCLCSFMASGHQVSQSQLFPGFFFDRDRERSKTSERTAFRRLDSTLSVHSGTKHVKVAPIETLSTKYGTCAYNYSLGIQHTCTGKSIQRGAHVARSFVRASQKPNACAATEKHFILVIFVPMTE